MLEDLSKKYPVVCDGVEKPEVRAERNKLFEDLCNGRIPDRVPIKLSVSTTVALEFAGYGIKESQFDPAAQADATEKFSKIFYSDQTPVGGQYPYVAYKILGYTHQEPNEEGILQHKNYTYCTAEELKEYNKDPYSFMINTLIPRKCTHLNGTGMENAMTLLKAYIAQQDYNASMGPVMRDINTRFNYENYLKVLGRTLAPFDFIADKVRSFPGSMVDIRRCPDLVLEAVDKTLEYKKFRVDRMHGSGPQYFTRIPFHMPTFMKLKDFEKFWWPSFKEMGEYIVASGRNMQIALEDNWTHLVDYAAEIPGRPILSIEECDNIPEFKKKVGDHAILEGGFPLEFTLYNDPQTVVDKAKEFIDTMAPGGNFVFSINKTPLILREFNPDSILAVLNFAREYGKY